MTGQRKLLALLPLFLLLIATSACAADYDDRIQYLRQVGIRGIEVHNLLSAQNTAVTPDACMNANAALNTDIPRLADGVDPPGTEQWRKLVEQTFVKACVLGQY